MKTVQGLEAHYRMDQMVNNPGKRDSQAYLVKGKQGTAVLLSLEEWQALTAGSAAPANCPARKACSACNFLLDECDQVLDTAYLG